MEKIYQPSATGSICGFDLHGICWQEECRIWPDLHLKVELIVSPQGGHNSDEWKKCICLKTQWALVYFSKADSVQASVPVVYIGYLSPWRHTVSIHSTSKWVTQWPASSTFNLEEATSCEEVSTELCWAHIDIFLDHCGWNVPFYKARIISVPSFLVNSFILFYTACQSSTDNLWNGVPTLHKMYCLDLKGYVILLKGWYLEGV